MGDGIARRERRGRDGGKFWRGYIQLQWLHRPMKAPVEVVILQYSTKGRPDEELKPKPLLFRIHGACMLPVAPQLQSAAGAGTVSAVRGRCRMRDNAGVN